MTEKERKKEKAYKEKWRKSILDVQKKKLLHTVTDNYSHSSQSSYDETIEENIEFN